MRQVTLETKAVGSYSHFSMQVLSLLGRSSIFVDLLSHNTFIYSYIQYIHTVKVTASKTGENDNEGLNISDFQRN